MTIENYNSLKEFFTEEEIHETFLTTGNFQNCPFIDCEHCKKF